MLILKTRLGAGDENPAHTDNIANDSFYQVWPSTLPMSCKTNPGSEQCILFDVSYSKPGNSSSFTEIFRPVSFALGAAASKATVQPLYSVPSDLSMVSNGRALSNL